MSHIYLQCYRLLHVPYMMAQCSICYCFALFFILNIYTTTAQPSMYNVSTANLSTTWNITNPVVYKRETIMIRPIFLLGEQPGIVTFACGFYCDGRCTSYLLAVYIVQIRAAGVIIKNDDAFPQVVWSANLDYPVSVGAILNFTATGDLVLQEVDGSIVWRTNTTGKSVVGMKLTDIGNLVLFDVNGSIVWQSFDYPTDCLVSGQTLYQGQQLIPSVSLTNWTAQKGLFSFQIINESLVASVGSNRPQVYYQTQRFLGADKYARFMNKSLYVIPFYEVTVTIPYMKFMSDGHLKLFDWNGTIDSWYELADLLTNNDIYGQCRYPLFCGRNAICSSNQQSNQQCSCPASSSPMTASSSPMIEYFRPVNDTQPNQGCSAITPLTCSATQDHVLIPHKNVSLYTYSPPDRENVSMEACKQACLNNCSCKAAVFDTNSGSSYGYAFYLLSSLQ